MVRQVRSALFVDFDNLYSDLQKLDATAAEKFASDPGHWVRWLERGDDVENTITRRFLVRACYLNPSVHSRHRSFFTRAGFRVIDCPSLTRQGKSSADIHLVIDALDALTHQVKYDEFIVCSADADFTPLMVRLRANDRRTVMIAAGLTAAAYRATCDEIIDSSQLVGTTALPGHKESTSNGRTEQEDIPNGENQLNHAWLPEHGTEALGTNLETKQAPNPRSAKSTTEVDQAHPESPGRPSSVVGQTVTPQDDAPLELVLEAIRQLVAASAEPVPGATAAGAALRVDPKLSEAGWDGTGGFAQFIAARLPDLAFVRSVSGGFVLDPVRHSAERILDAPVELTIEAKVSRVTDVPRLSHSQYVTLFTELSADLLESGFNLTTTPRRVRERSASSGSPVSRSAVLAVSRELRRAGVRLEGGSSATYLAKCWRDRVLDLCEAARMELSEEDRNGIDTWLLIIDDATDD